MVQVDVHRVVRGFLSLITSRRLPFSRSLSAHFDVVLGDFDRSDSADALVVHVTAILLRQRRPSLA